MLSSRISSPHPSAKTTSEGEKVIKLLMTRYGMSREGAIKLLWDGGPSLAVSLLTLVKKGVS